MATSQRPNYFEKLSNNNVLVGKRDSSGTVEVIDILLPDSEIDRNDDDYINIFKRRSSVTISVFVSNNKKFTLVTSGGTTTDTYTRDQLYIELGTNFFFLPV